MAIIHSSLSCGLKRMIVKIFPVMIQMSEYTPSGYVKETSLFSCTNTRGKRLRNIKKYIVYVFL